MGEATVAALTEPAETAPVDYGVPELSATLPTALLDHAAVTWRHPAQRARWECPPRRSAASGRPWTGSRTPPVGPRLISQATKSPVPTCSPSTTSAGQRATQGRSSTSSSWSASSSRSRGRLVFQASSRTTQCAT
ncbi:MAG: hypothetical protein R2734_07795 [Nocardioides sp.]